MIDAKPENLIGDHAYDSDKLDEELRQEGIEMISPHKKKPGQTLNAGRSQTAALRATLARGTFHCLDSVATPPPGAMGILCREFSRFRVTRKHRYSAKAILR